MQLFIFVLLICLFIFLYCMYILANDDFIFLRRDVTMEKLFNIIFLGALISLLSSRLFYGLFYSKSVLANPLVFLLFPYFPGLSLAGGVAGVAVYLLFLMTRQKSPLPVGRIADFFSIAFLISLPVGFIGYLMFAPEAEVLKAGSQAGAYFVLFIIFVRFFLPRLLNGKFKEGTISFIFLMCFSAVSLIANAFSKISILNFFTNFENLILIAVFFGSAFFLTKQEDLSSTFFPRKKH